MAIATLGKVIAERRARMSLSLKELGARVPKEDGRGVSAQYLHDIERDRRIPSPHVLAGLARALEVEPSYLAAVAGQAPAEVVLYLREHPEAAAAVSAAFARARQQGVTEWDSVARGRGTH